MQDEKPIELKVRSSTRVNELATSIAMNFKENPHRTVEITTIGAGATNQAIKAIAAARGILSSSSAIDLGVKPFFSEAIIEGETRTTIRMRCFDAAR